MMTRLVVGLILAVILGFVFGANAQLRWIEKRYELIRRYWRRPGDLRMTMADDRD
jgi:hypothetical protein